MKCLLALLLSLAGAVGISAQAQQEWVARYIGPFHLANSASAIALDAAGHVYVTGVSQGRTTSYFADYATVKYDSDGTELWAARYAGPGQRASYPHAMALDASNNVYVTGYSHHEGPGTDYATVKYDSDGNQLWVARYNGQGDGFDEPFAIAVDGAGNVYVTGRSRRGDIFSASDYATVKYDADGTELWAARYSSTSNSVALAMTLDADGNVYVTGYSVEAGTGAGYLTVKYDADGNQRWVARYDGPPGDRNFATGIALDAAGNVYVTGNSNGAGTGADYATVKYDADGNQLWAARYNGPADGDDIAVAIALSGGSVYVTGRSRGVSTASDYATVKYSSDGDELWVARYHGTAIGFDEAVAMALDVSGNVYVTGKSVGPGDHADYATVKYDSGGTEQWVARYHGPGADSDDVARAIALDAAGNVYVTGDDCEYSDEELGCLSGAFGTIKYSQIRE